MDFWLWVIFPFLVFGILSFIKEGKAVGNWLFSKQQWGILDCVYFLAIETLSHDVLRSQYFPIRLSGEIVNFLGHFISLVILTIYIRYKLKQSLTNLGMHVSHLSENILYGLKGVLPWIFLSIILQLLIKALIDTPLLGTGQSGDSWIILLRLIHFVVLGPFVEELVYRGFLYGPVRRRAGRRISILLSSAIFTSTHVALFSERSPVVVFLLGCLFAYLYEQQESLIPSITAHSLWNFAAFLRDIDTIDRLLFIPPEHFLTFLIILVVGLVVFLSVVHRLHGRFGKKCER